MSMDKLLLMEKVIDMTLPLSVRVDLCELYVYRNGNLPSADFNLLNASLPEKIARYNDLAYVEELLDSRFHGGLIKKNPNLIDDDRR